MVVIIPPPDTSGDIESSEAELGVILDCYYNNNNEIIAIIS